MFQERDSRWGVRVTFLLTGLVVLSCAGPGVSADPQPGVLKFEAGDDLVTLQEKIERNGYEFTVASNWVFEMPPEEKERIAVGCNVAGRAPHPTEPWKGRPDRELRVAEPNPGWRFADPGLRYKTPSG